MRKLFIALLWSVILPACAVAQQADSAHARNRCRQAAHAVETGHPAPHLGWAYEQLRACGAQGGSVLAKALLNLRTSSDSAALEAVTAPMYYLRDGTVFSAALTIAQDRGASEMARVHALRILLWALSPGNLISYRQMAGGDGVEFVCYGAGRTFHYDPYGGMPLPPGYPEQIRSAVAEVFGDRDAPAAVRQAARCVTRHLRRR